MNISHRNMSIRTSPSVLDLTGRTVKPVMRSHLKMHQLALLVHLDEEHCIVRAATAAGLTQPAASKLLRQIEATLDVKLFERHARGVAPTPFGEILVRHARQVLSELRLAQEEVAALKAGLAGKAGVGTIVDPGTNLVPMAIARMKQRSPATLVRVEIDSSQQLVRRLVQGHLDMVIARLLDETVIEKLAYEPLAADEPYVVVAGVRHPFAGRTPLRLQDLIGQSWILPPHGSLIREKLAGMFLRENLPQPTDIVEASSLPVVMGLLEQGDMVAAMPAASVQSGCRAEILTVLVSNLPVQLGGFGLITRRDHRLSPEAQLMLSLLRQAATDLYSPGRLATAVGT